MPITLPLDAALAQLQRALETLDMLGADIAAAHVMQAIEEANAFHAENQAGPALRAVGKRATA